MKRAWHSLLAFAALVALAAAPAAADPRGAGKLSGVVVDPAGVPQMGATVAVLPENLLSSKSFERLTNEKGIFSIEGLLPGQYSVRVTLAGFLPALERHIRVEANLTTLLRIELDSVLTALQRLRQQPQQPAEPDDWAWVLRTAAATRPVLRFAGGDLEVVYAADADGERRGNAAPQGRFELTAGARRPGSVSNLADAPAAAFAYDQSLGRRGHLLLAGQASYERTPSGGFTAVWLPTGDANTGPATTMVLRQSALSPEGPGFFGVRISHTNQVALSEHWTVRYGSEVVRVNLGRSALAIRPQGELVFRASPRWRASLWLGAQPSPDNGLSETPLVAALEQMDAFPVVMLRDGRPVLDGGWHQEVAVERVLGEKASVVAAVFRDRSRHTAIFARGAPPGSDFLPDFYSQTFAFDGGELNSWGARVGLRQKVSEDLETLILYAWAGALTKEDSAAATADPREAFQVRARHSLAGRVSTRMPWSGTRITAGYKWIAGPALSRQDAFGESIFQVDPNLSLTLRQPLPTFFTSGRLEAVVDVRNLLAQGYVPVSTSEGTIVCVSQFRTIRGGFAFQF